jgi:hypothetical protein
MFRHFIFLHRDWFGAASRPKRWTLLLLEYADPAQPAMAQISGEPIRFPQRTCLKPWRRPLIAEVATVGLAFVTNPVPWSTNRCCQALTSKFISTNAPMPISSTNSG